MGMQGLVNSELLCIRFYANPILSKKTGLFQQFWEKAPGKKINLTAKLGEINDIEHNKGSKIYPQKIKFF